MDNEQHAYQTMSERSRVVRRWRQGMGSDWQHVLLVAGPWGLRLVEVWHVWKVWTVHNERTTIRKVQRLAAARRLSELASRIPDVDLVTDQARKKSS